MDFARDGRRVIVGVPTNTAPNVILLFPVEVIRQALEELILQFQGRIAVQRPALGPVVLQDLVEFRLDARMAVERQHEHAVICLGFLRQPPEVGRPQQIADERDVAGRFRMHRHLHAAG